MRLLADLTVRSSLIVLAGLAANVALRHRSAALRHAVLALPALRMFNSFNRLNMTAGSFCHYFLLYSRST